MRKSWVRPWKCKSSKCDLKHHSIFTCFAVKAWMDTVRENKMFKYKILARRLSNNSYKYFFWIDKLCIIMLRCNLIRYLTYFTSKFSINWPDLTDHWPGTWISSVREFVSKAFNSCLSSCYNCYRAVVYKQTYVLPCNLESRKTGWSDSFPQRCCEPHVARSETAPVCDGHYAPILSRTDETSYALHRKSYFLHELRLWPIQKSVFRGRKGAKIVDWTNKEQYWWSEYDWGFAYNDSDILYSVVETSSDRDVTKTIISLCRTVTYTSTYVVSEKEIEC